MPIDPSDATHRLFVCPTSTDDGSANRRQIRAENRLIDAATTYGDRVTAVLWEDGVSEAKPEQFDEFTATFSRQAEEDRTWPEDGIEYSAQLPEGRDALLELLSLSEDGDPDPHWRLYDVRHVIVTVEDEWICHVFPESKFERDLRITPVGEELLDAASERVTPIDGVGLFPVPALCEWTGEQNRYTLKPDRLGVTPIHRPSAATEWYPIQQLAQIFVDAERRTIRLAWQRSDGVLSTLRRSVFGSRPRDPPAEVRCAESTGFEEIEAAFRSLRETCNYEYRIETSTEQSPADGSAGR